MFLFKKTKKTSGKRDSDPRPQPWQGCALPTELLPQKQILYSEEEETRTPTTQLSLPPQSSASTYSATIAYFPKWEMFFNQYLLHHLEDKC